MEVALQQIISLRRAAARNEQLLDQYHDYIEDMADKLRRRTGKLYTEDRKNWREEIERLNHEINRLNNETAERQVAFAIRTSRSRNSANLLLVGVLGFDEGDDPVVQVV